MEETQKNLQELGIESRPEDILPFPNIEKQFEAKLPGLTKDRDQAKEKLDKLEGQRKKKRAEYFRDLGNETRIQDLRELMQKVFAERANYFRILKEIAIAESIVEGKKKGLTQEQLQKLVSGNPTSNHFASYEDHWLKMQSGLASGGFIEHVHLDGDPKTFEDPVNPKVKRIQYNGLDWKQVEALKYWLPEVYEGDIDKIAKRLRANKKLKVRILIPPISGIFRSYEAGLKAMGKTLEIGQKRPRAFYFNAEDLEAGVQKPITTDSLK